MLVTNEMKKDIVMEVLINEYGYTKEEALEDIDSLMEDFEVFTEDKADERAHELCINLIDDCGIESFNIDISEYIDEDYMRDTLEEYYWGYIEDIATEPSDYEEYDNRLEQEMNEEGFDNEDDYIDYLVGNGDYVERYIDIFGKESLNILIENNDAILDKDAIAKYCVDVDGAGHFIASYDGIEHEVERDGELYLVYRIN